MGQFNLPSANNVPVSAPSEKTLPIEKKQAWNTFVDYLDQLGYKGNAALDNRNTNLGQQLMAKFNADHPNMPLSYADVPVVQSELQNYRQSLVNKWQGGQASADGVKSADDIMPGLSKVDGWLGSKTSSYKFPTASITNQTTGQKQQFGLNTDLYDKAMQAKNK